MRTTKKIVVAAGACGIGIALWLIPGALDTPEASPAPQVIVMRCVPMPSPGFGYQVATFSKTPSVTVQVDASTEEGLGDDCAVALSEIIASGIPTTRMTAYADASALVVTFIK